MAASGGLAAMMRSECVCSRVRAYVLFALLCVHVPQHMCCLWRQAPPTGLPNHTHYPYKYRSVPLTCGPVGSSLRPAARPCRRPSAALLLLRRLCQCPAALRALVHGVPEEAGGYIRLLHVDEHQRYCPAGMTGVRVHGGGGVCTVVVVWRGRGMRGGGSVCMQLGRGGRSERVRSRVCRAQVTSS